MQELNVRCCCQPTKILGRLKLPADIRCGEHQILDKDGKTHVIKLMNSKTVVIDDESRTESTFEEMRAAPKELAVYSDDRPIEFWRNVEGFTEIGIGGGIRTPD